MKLREIENSKRGAKRMVDILFISRLYIGRGKINFNERKKVELLFSTDRLGLLVLVLIGLEIHHYFVFFFFFKRRLVGTLKKINFPMTSIWHKNQTNLDRFQLFYQFCKF